MNEIVQEMEYLRIREQKLRDTNESTNERVKWFALGTMGMLVGLGAWQVVYLRAYFRYVFWRGCVIRWRLRVRKGEARGGENCWWLGLTDIVLQIEASHLERHAYGIPVIDGTSLARPRPCGAPSDQPRPWNLAARAEGGDDGGGADLCTTTTCQRKRNIQQVNQLVHRADRHDYWP